MENPARKQQYLQMADMNPAQLLQGETPRLIDEWQLAQPYDYIDAVAESDISRVDEVERDAQRARKILRAYARNVASEATVASLLKDVRGEGSDTFSENTLRSYLSALRRIFVIEDTSAWNPNLRSKTVIQSSDTRYFVDTSIAAAALGVGSDDLINDLATAGLLFENLCVRDLRIFAGALDGRVYHYRDKRGLECDAVVHLRNGRYGLVEIKLGGDKLIEEGAANLLKLKNSIDITRMNVPSFMMVLCGIAPYAYQRPDGVLVVPAGCLGC